MNSQDILHLCDVIRETGFALHKYLRNGHLEKVYVNGLFHRLRKQGLDVQRQVPLKVHDEDGTVIGDFFADLLVNQVLLVKVKAYRALGDEHVAELLGILRASRIEHGLLMNFGATRFQIRKYVLSQEFPQEGITS